MPWHLNCIERYARQSDRNELAEKLKMEVSSLSHCCPYGKCGTNQELFKTANSMTKRNNTSFFCLARHLPFEEIWGLKACGLLTDFTLQSLPKIIVLNHNVQNGIDSQHLLNQPVNHSTYFRITKFVPYVCTLHVAYLGLTRRPFNQKCANHRTKAPNMQFLASKIDCVAFSRLEKKCIIRSSPPTFALKKQLVVRPHFN